MNSWEEKFRTILAEIVVAIFVGSLGAVVVALAIKFISWLF